MTDPFSVGAGVVGVLSLGITVCQGLAAYYGPFTQFDSETKALIQKAEGLTSTLQQLETLLNPLQNPLNSPPDEVHLVTQRIKDCQDELEGLCHALTKCRGCDATTVIEKSGWYYARKALYPFKRGTLISLTETVSNLQSNLDTALLVLNLALSKRLEDQTTLTLSVSKSIAAGTTDISTTLTRIEQGQQQIFQAIQRFQQAGVSSPRALPPATLQSLCDQQQHVNRQLRKHAPPRHAPKSKSASCTCPQEAPRRWKFFPKFQLHRFGCPLYFQGEEMTLFHGRYAFCNRFLGFSIQFSMNAISGAGGLTIYPLFDVRRVVPHNAPAFKLIDEFFNNLYMEWGGHSLNSVLLRMQRLFEDGEASPRDTLSDGTTLLHHAVDKLVNFDDELFPSFVEMVETLVLVCHVPINERRTVHGEVYTALDLLFDMPLIFSSILPNRDHFTSLILNLLANDGEITKLPFLQNPGFWFGNAAHLFLPRVVNELCPQDLELSDLEVVILKRSKEDLKSFLEHNNTEDITVKDAVFLSMVEWPSGLDLILKSSISHHHRDIKLMLAVSSSQKKSVGLLLAAGWPVSGMSLYMAAHLSDNMEIFRMITDALAKRRRHLLTSARERLNLNELTLHADMDDLSMKNTRIIYRTLKESDCGIHEAIFIDEVEIFPVYECVGRNREAADILYEAGLTNVEERSPISRLDNPDDDELGDYLDICSWFKTKGASLYSKSLGTRTLPIHHIARCVGGWLRLHIRLQSGQIHETQKNAISRHRALLKDVLADTEHHDSCSCACSVGGCLPSTILIAKASGELDFWSPNDASTKLSEFLDSVTSDKLKEMHDILAPVVLRLYTFNELQITHTCRYHFVVDESKGEVSLGDVPEVQAEERHLIDQLEELVFEFEGKYKELNVPLPEFLSGYWRDRMDEVEAEEELFDEEEAQRMREVGVIVECPSSDSE